jgi:hypothetical protein
MSVRPEIRELAALGQLPLEEAATEEQINKYEAALRPIRAPVTDEEARVLASLFPSAGTTFGLAWQLVHLIETGYRTLTSTYAPTFSSHSTPSITGRTYSRYVPGAVGAWSRTRNQACWPGPTHVVVC